MQPQHTMKAINSGYFYILVTITLTVIGQLLVKAGMLRVASSLSREPARCLSMVFTAFLEPLVVAGLACAVLAAVSWFPAVARLPISIAYPFMALSIVLVLALAPICFGERVSLNQWIGVILVSCGLWLATH